MIYKEQCAAGWVEVRTHPHSHIWPSMAIHGHVESDEMERLCGKYCKESAPNHLRSLTVNHGAHLTYCGTAKQLRTPTG